MQQCGFPPGFLMISRHKNVTQVSYLIFKSIETPLFSNSYVNIVTNGPVRFVRVCMGYDDEKPI